MLVRYQTRPLACYSVRKPSKSALAPVPSGTTACQSAVTRPISSKKSIASCQLHRRQVYTPYPLLNATLPCLILSALTSTLTCSCCLCGSVVAALRSSGSVPVPSAGAVSFSGSGSNTAGTKSGHSRLDKRDQRNAYSPAV